jgi:fructosamine-3-kinase
MANQLAESAAALLGGELQSIATVGGGDLSLVLRIVLSDGRRAIVKGGPAPATEAAMLDAIRAAGAPAPVVLGCDTSVLVLEELPDDGRLDTAWGSLGTTLARLHGAEGDRFGWSADYAFGRVTIENGWDSRWPSFWAERRLANQAAHLPADLARRVSALAADLPNRLPAEPAAVLLHGDLWSGNVLASGGEVSGLIDPACYYGHREVDLAMLRLFGHPDTALFDAYGGLEPDHQSRLPLYQLWPALVHLRLFGGGYRPLVERLLAQAGV